MKERLKSKETRRANKVNLLLRFHLSCVNRPRSIYQYFNMAPRLSGQTSLFGVFKPLLGIEIRKKLEKFAILTPKPRSHVRIERLRSRFFSISREPRTSRSHVIKF